MPLLRVNIDDELALALRTEAQSAGKSLSALVVEKLRRNSFELASQHWDAVFERLRTLPAGELKEAEELPWSAKDFRLDDLSV